MNNIRHEEDQWDSLYSEFEQNLDTIYTLWAGRREENNHLLFSIPILCAVKLEAFINIAGTLKIDDWDISRRNLSFNKKCQRAFAAVNLIFDLGTEPNKTAIDTFKIRNSLVHSTMPRRQINEVISQEEYERRSKTSPFKSWVFHHLRSELTEEKVEQIKDNCDSFVEKWGPIVIGKHYHLRLRGGSMGGVTFNPQDKT